MNQLHFIFDISTQEIKKADSMTIRNINKLIKFHKIKVKKDNKLKYIDIEDYNNYIAKYVNYKHKNVYWVAENKITKLMNMMYQFKKNMEKYSEENNFQFCN